jgi:ribosomal protein L16/L10AE
LFEVAGCSITIARQALSLADAKLPFRCRLVSRVQSF